jgi:PTS system glucitol/sorbitol-specific IIC component
MSMIMLLQHGAGLLPSGIGPVHPAVGAGLRGAIGAHQSALALAADTTPVTPSTTGPISAQTYAERVQALPTTSAHLGWLTAIGTGFIGIFQKGGAVFASFVTGIIPTLVVLMTAFYAITEFVGEQRVHGIARTAGKIALTRYTVLPILAVFFLTNPMAYTFGTFLDEKYKPAFYDSAVSFVHPVLGLFPHCNPGEYFVWGGVLVALLQLEKEGKVPPNFHVTVAIYYFAVGVVVILLKGIVTEWVTRIMARRQGVVL